MDVLRWLREFWPQLLLALVAATLVAHALRNPQEAPQQGDECGPGHHWRYIGQNAAGADLSCEPDARP